MNGTDAQGSHLVGPLEYWKSRSIRFLPGAATLPTFFRDRHNRYTHCNSFRNLPDQQKDDFEQPLATAHSLMRQGKGEDACRLLFRARDRAVSSGDSTEACLFASVRGSYLVAMDRNREALNAYLEAEGFSDGQANQKLTTARHLLYGMSQPAKALAKVDEVLESSPNTAAVDQECRAVQGLGLLFLGRPEEAIAALEVMISELPSAQLPSLSCDLTLVEELARRRLAVAECSSYLDLVETKAGIEREKRVLDHVLRLKALLQDEAPGNDI